MRSPSRSSRRTSRERRDGMDGDELLAAVDAACGRALMAISAPAETPVDVVEEEAEAEPASEEEPDVVFTDLEQFDWLDTNWTTDCTFEGDLRNVTLTLDGSEGVHRPAEPSEVPIYTVDLDDVVYGDVTGDGHDEAIFVTRCDFVSIEERVEVWSHDVDGAPLHLPPVNVFSKFDGLVGRVEVVGGFLRIHSNEGAQGDDMPHMNGYPEQVATDWSFEADDQQWLATEVERSDTRPAPSPDVDRYTDRRDPSLRDAFQLPSGNIACALLVRDDPASDPYLHCDIGTGLDPIPSESCELDWAGIVLSMQGTAGPDCRGDVWTTAPTDPYPVLGYGETWSYEDITCRSSESGLSCENRSGGAFSLARSSWDAR